MNQGLAYLVYLPIYNLFFHPLRHFPGPKLWAMTRIPYTRNNLSGQPQKGILKLHQTYGPFVRITPETLSISHPDVAIDLKGHRKGGKEEHGKDPVTVASFVHNIIGADRENHTRFRQVMSHGFSAQAMLEQQPTIQKYVDTLLRRLHGASAGGTKPVDMVSWYNYTTFDVIGDLAFGEPFHCLENSDYHPWVRNVFLSFKHVAFESNLLRYPFGEMLRRLIAPKELAVKQKEHAELSQMKVRKRLAIETDRPDFIGKMVKGRAGKGRDMTFQELASNASLLIVAGSETTATLLSAATFYLTENRQVLTKLTEEVRAAFTSETDIDLVSTQALKYMQAVLEESLRLYPPANGAPRKIARGGDHIAGKFIPEKTLVEIPQFATYRNPEYFTQPDEFIPERFLGDDRFKNDKREVMQSFSVGPRNCIGRNLAYSEMRLIMARMVWNFDMRIAEDSHDWVEKSEFYLLWDKPPLNVYLTPRLKI
ncbi:Isotrichodermin C-15 hydroxylase [Xylariales sp. AK1849]|nr:Isotrichodermin C-15 hydroxylase [Xylariales sp. AK1849]